MPHFDMVLNKSLTSYFRLWRKETPPKVWSYILAVKKRSHTPDLTVHTLSNSRFSVTIGLIFSMKVLTDRGLSVGASSN